MKEAMTQYKLFVKNVRKAEMTYGIIYYNTDL